MADATGKKLLKLLHSSCTAEVRKAAVVVLGELGNKEKENADAVAALLEDEDADLRLAAMKTAGKLHVEQALPKLLDRVRLGGPEADVAAQAAARLGTKGIRALQDVMAHTAPGLRRRIAAALAAAGSSNAELIALDSVLDADAGMVDAVTRTLAAEIHALAPAQRRALNDHILELMKPKKGTSLPPHSEAALLRLLAAVGDPANEAVFWSRTEANYPPALRAEALQALGMLPAPTNVAQQKRLLACALDREFRVVAPALMILKAVPVKGSAWKEWLSLLQAPDVAVRRFVIDKLAEHDTEEVAQALLPQLKHPDRALREQALASLAKRQHGAAALVELLLEADTPDAAWQLARMQAALVKHYPPALQQKLFKTACTYLEGENDDRRADALLFLLNEADAKELREQLAERAVAFRKKKQYPRALVYLKLLGRDPACGEGLRFELAACGLKLSTHDLSPAARQADPALHQFTRLLNNHETHPQTYLEKAGWLEPEDLFYLGFHFVEGAGAERDFGAQVLRWLLKKSPKAKQAKDAKSKLKGAGLA